MQTISETAVVQAQFEGWAIVEIMGHQSAAGWVTTKAFGSVVMFQITQPEVAAEVKLTEKQGYRDGRLIPPLIGVR